MTRTAFPTRFLHPGMHIRVIAPSSPFSIEELMRGVELLRARYVVSYDAGLLEQTGFLAGSDDRRLLELRDAIADRSVDAIFAARGGYGASRILPGLQPADIAARGLMLVGFSDITALHALWARAGVGSVHGPMVAALGRGDSAQLERVISAVEGRGDRLIAGLETLAPGRALGPLLGGNLAVLTALLGTPYFPNLRGSILLLEDIGERPYRIDRMLTSLLHSGQLDEVVGVVLGAFTKAAPAADGVTATEVLKERLSKLGVPVLSGAPIGHLEVGNLPVVLGALAELDTDRGTLVFPA